MDWYFAANDKMVTPFYQYLMLNANNLDGDGLNFKDYGVPISPAAPKTNAVPTGRCGPSTFTLCRSSSPLRSTRFSPSTVTMRRWAKCFTGWIKGSLGFSVLIPGVGVR